MRQLSTGQLADWLAHFNREPQPLLVDVRRADEFAVSHLPGARNVTTIEGIRAIGTSPNQPIVLYCSVGYRSSALAEKLHGAGLTNIWNLEGSIFAWANEGRAVYRGPAPLRPPKVHPYDRKWGQLLNLELRDPAQ